MLVATRWSHTAGKRQAVVSGMAWWCSWGGDADGIRVGLVGVAQPGR